MRGYLRLVVLAVNAGGEPFHLLIPACLGGLDLIRVSGDVTAEVFFKRLYSLERVRRYLYAVKLAAVEGACIDRNYLSARIEPF